MKSLLGLLGVALTGGIAFAQMPTSLPTSVGTGDSPSVQIAPPPASPAQVPMSPGVQIPPISTPSQPETWQGGIQTYPSVASATQFNAGIGSELYYRMGPSIIVGGGALRQSLNTAGLQIDGGGRTLFFDSDGAAAWTFDLGIDFIYNRGSTDNALLFQGGILDEHATIHNVERAAVQFALGREWFDGNSASVTSHTGSFWRYGLDAGMRWGTGHTRLTNVNPYQYGVSNSSGTATALVAQYIERIQDVYGAAFVGANLNLEVPMGGTWSFITGFRTEAAYTFSDLVPGNSGVLLEVSFLFQIGVRF